MYWCGQAPPGIAEFKIRAAERLVLWSAFQTAVIEDTVNADAGFIAQWAV